MGWKEVTRPVGEPYQYHYTEPALVDRLIHSYEKAMIDILTISPADSPYFGKTLSIPSRKKVQE